MLMTLYCDAFFFFSSRRRHTRCALVTGVQTCALPIYEPWTVQTRSKGWFRVFSPFWRACRAGPEPAAPLVAPQSLTPCTDSPAGLQLDDFDLRPRQIGRASCRERVCQYV